MPKLSEVQRELPSILLYGGAGTGKTHFCMTGGELTEYLGLDLNVASTPLGLRDAHRENRLKVEFFPCYDSGPKVADGITKCRNRIAEIHRQIRDGKYPYKIVVLDSLTMLSMLAIRGVQYSKGIYDLGSVTRPLTQPEWGIVVNDISVILQLFVALPKVCRIVVAHDEHVMDSSGNVIRVQIRVNGKDLPVVIPTWFDEIWGTYVHQGGGTNVAYRIRTIPENNSIVRSHAGIPNNSNQSEGLIELLKKGGYTL